MSLADAKLPVSGGVEKRAYVRRMFHDIAPTYDTLNRIISLRLDLRWRRRALRFLGWERAPRGRYLDLCAGTLDFGATLARQPGFGGSIVGADFVPRMLALGRHKAAALEPVTADALALPFADATFDGAVIGWGARNFADLDAGLREVWRVLRPGARLVVLDMSTPPNPAVRAGFRLYFERVLPWVGRLVSKHTTAYLWLPASTRVFPDAPALAARLRDAGFTAVEFERLLLGATAIHAGTKPASGGTS